MSNTRTWPTVRVAAVLLVAFVLASGLALTSGAQASGGLTCTGGEGSLSMSWNGETHVRQYTAYVINSAEEQISQIVPWWSSTAPTASTTFSSLSAGTYTVYVDKHTTSGSIIEIGRTTCTVTAPTATPTATATPTPTATPTAAASGAGTISCSASNSSITVTLDPETGTDTWEATLQHSSGYPKIGGLVGAAWSQEQLAILNNDDPDDDEAVLAAGPAGSLQLSMTFESLAQGTWNISGSARIAGQSEWSTLAAISCTVSGGL